jgi:hypothetical protein
MSGGPRREEKIEVRKGIGSIKKENGIPKVTAG